MLSRHVFIRRKKPNEIIDALMTNWIVVFGVMEAINSDNEVEFSSEEMGEVILFSISVFKLQQE